MTIPVFKPSITDEEIQAVTEVLRSGWLGLGPKTAEFERLFAEKMGVRYCVGLNSCTAALHLAVASLGLQPGDEVIVTPMTFISTVHSIVYSGATPVFADIQPDTLNIDPEDVAAKVSPKTKAIICVDMAGHPCELDRLTEIAAKNGLTLIEDAAHACGAFYKNQPVGSIAPLTCFSFHAVKNLTCGEGGAITGNDPWKDQWFRKMRWLGISKDTWSRTGNEDCYQWKYWVEEIGFKCHMNDIPAALGIVQLKRLPQLNAARRLVVSKYNNAFQDLDWLVTPVERPYVQSSWHLYQVKLNDEKNRDNFVNYLAKNGVTPGVHYIPSFMHPCYRKIKAVCPVASEVWKRIVTLPIFPDLSEQEQDYIIDMVRSFQP